MFQRIINNLNVCVSRCTTSTTDNFGGEGVLTKINKEQICIRITHLIIFKGVLRFSALMIVVDPGDKEDNQWGEKLE